MLLKIRHALLEISNYPNVKKSAIIINNEIIITTGLILQDYFETKTKPDANNNDTNIVTRIIRNLQQSELINVQDDSLEEAVYLNSFNYQVIFDRRKLPATPSRNQKAPHILTRYSAKLLYLFSSDQLLRFAHNFLNVTNDAANYDDVLLSSFLVLTIRPQKQRSKEKFDRFFQHIAHYLCYFNSVKPLDDVLVMCTPFGLENFYKTISIGKVSNVMGRNGCLFVLSNALPMGCEGSAVFNNKLHLVGMIVCTSFRKGNENVNMTMAANFSYLLRDFMGQLGVKITSVTIPKEPTNFAWERTMVVVEANGSQGTGTFVKVQNMKFILTCAHVVFNVESKVSCRSVDGEFETEILWRNPEYDRPFDVAILSAPENIPNKYCVGLSRTKPSPGQTVFNAGFPYFVNFHLKYDFNPSIFQGRIVKCNQGAIMSDGCVQAGQSGGPMFDQFGNILGICVSNIKIENTVYPNLNTAVPIYEIRQTLKNFATTKDITILNNLVANKEIQRIWALEPPPIALSKL